MSQSRRFEIRISSARISMIRPQNTLPKYPLPKVLSHAMNLQSYIYVITTPFIYLTNLYTAMHFCFQTTELSFEKNNYCVTG